MDHDRLGCLITLSSLENVMFPETIAWVVDDVHGKRSLDFGWNQVARKS
jgi:hypothetical protein